VRGGLPDAGNVTLTPKDTAHLLRRGAAEAEAVVEFVGNDGIAYRARWCIRRARNRPDGKLQKVEMSLARCDDGIPIGHLKTEVLKAIEARIGLDFAQFTRAVLLAQNEFAAFLKADEDERAKLLQTLTGTDTFEAISIAVFERARDEGNRLAELEGRRALHPVLAPDARAALDAAIEAVQVRTEAQQAAREQLELAARWHVDERTLAAAVAAARDAQAAAVHAHDHAATRRLELARIDAARGARAEVQAGEQARMELEAAGVAATTAADEEAGAHARVAIAEAEAQSAEVARALAAAAQADAAPALARARTLDAQLAERERALTDAHAEASRTQDAESTARVALDAVLDALGQAERQRDEARAWLAGNAHLGVLGEQWARWDATLQDAAAAAGERAAATDARDGNAASLAQAQAAAEAAAVDVDAAGARAAAAIAMDDEARAAEQALDADALERDRRAAEARREQLARGADALRALDAAQARLGELAGALEDATAEIARCDAGRLAVLARIGPAEAAAAQAQLAVERAQLAVASDVSRLREGLEDGVPCPVCGSTAHPWRTEVPALDALLQALQADARGCTAALRELEREGSVLAARADAAATQAAVARAAQPAAVDARDAAERAWAATGLDAGLGASEGPARQRWVEDAQADNRDAQAACAAREAALAQARSAATRAANARRVDEKALATAREHAARAQGDLGRLAAAHEASVREAEGAAQRLAQRLDALDAAFARPGAVLLADWRAHWARDRLRFHADWRARAGEWRSRVEDERAASEDARAAAARAENERVAVAAAQAAAQRAATAAATAGEACERVRTARAALFDGQDTSAVEHGFAEAVRSTALAFESARARVARGQQALAAATTQRTEAGRRLARARDAADAAHAGLERWLAAWPLPGVPAPEPAELGALLARDEAVLAREREDLQAIDAALAAATVRLDERVQQHARHVAARTDARDAAEVATALEACSQALAADRAALGELQLQQRIDDEHGQQGRDLAEAIVVQEATTRTWRQLAELVGSADGRKFRNYAQQLTLEVLLAHANVHLATLARRYRLERTDDSLSLRVVDQDMADERRLVHSLSGGESFLVSLGLALGLASLSSHRVRVESLFIDEGFGSLDQETLRVAMDALDVLQSQGRKVGVISHVPEMTERIGTRIEVRRQAGGRSVVRVT
jgi:exonuclease SbcC